VLVGGWIGCASVSDPDGFILSLDVADGHTQWQQRTSGPITRLSAEGSAVVANGYDDVTSPAVFAAYDVTTGNLLWDRGGACGWGSSFIVGSHVVSTTVCGTVSLSTGATLWSLPTTTRKGWTFFRADGPGVTGRSIYAQNPFGDVVAMSPNGKARWNAGPGYGEVLAAGGGQVYVACLDGTSVCALDRLTGAQNWAAQTHNLVGVVSASDFVVLPGDNSVLRASDGGAVATLSISFGTRQSAAVADGRIVRVDNRDIDVYELDS
jgi:outer membrane protein assembly factor BamB